MGERAVFVFSCSTQLCLYGLDQYKGLDVQDRDHYLVWNGKSPLLRITSVHTPAGNLSELRLFAPTDYLVSVVC